MIPFYAINLKASECVLDLIENPSNWKNGAQWSASLKHLSTEVLWWSEGLKRYPQFGSHNTDRRYSLSNSSTPTLRKLYLYFLSHWMGYDFGDSFHFNFELNRIPFGSKLGGKLSPRSHPIQCEWKWNTSFLSVKRLPDRLIAVR